MRSRARVLSSLVALLAGCASDPMLEVRQFYYAGQYEEADQALVALERDDASNAHVYQMERGIVALARFQPAEAERALRPARDRLDALTETDWENYLGSMLLDDRQLEYAGADYEKVMVRAVLALANLMQRGGDADAYALQVLEKQQEIIESFKDDKGFQPKNSYKLVAFGSYLRAILNEADPLKRGVAKSSYEKVLELEPSFPFATDDIERVTNGKHSEKGNGVVHVIAMVGKGPFRVESEERVTRDVLAIAQVIWSIARDRATIPNVAAVKIPAMSYWQDNPTEVHVVADGRKVGQTEVITDVEETAQKEFAAMKDYAIARAVLRRAFKIVTTEGVKEATNRGRAGAKRDLIDIGISAAGLLWSAFEAADLRCWSLLPASFQVLRIELPAGDHEIEVRSGRSGAPIDRPSRLRVQVRDGYNTFVLAVNPTLDTAPTLLTSDPAAAEPVGEKTKT